MEYFSSWSIGLLDSFVWRRKRYPISKDLDLLDMYQSVCMTQRWSRSDGSASE